MAFRFEFKTERQLDEDIETARAALKKLDPDNRPNSVELQKLEQLQAHKDKQLHSRIGIAFPEAYLRVESISATVDNFTVVATIYANQQARQDGVQALATITKEFPPAGEIAKDPITYAYGLLRQSGLLIDPVDE